MLFLGWFVPAVVIIAIITFVVWAVSGPRGSGLCGCQCGGGVDHRLPGR
jgi:cation transport ATPase